MGGAVLAEGADAGAGTKALAGDASEADVSGVGRAGRGDYGAGVSGERTGWSLSPNGFRAAVTVYRCKFRLPAFI